MNGAVIHPGDKVTVTLTSNDEKDLKNNNLPDKNEKQIQRSKTLPEGSKQRLQENHKTKDGKQLQRPTLTSRRSSSLLSLNIEGLLIVPELEKRLRRNSYGGVSANEAQKAAEKETAVDPSDGMLTTSLCSTEL